MMLIKQETTLNLIFIITSCVQVKQTINNLKIMFYIFMIFGIVFRIKNPFPMNFNSNIKTRKQLIKINNNDKNNNNNNML